MPFRNPSRQQSRQMSVDPHNEIHVHQDHYIGVDVGTGSARACIMNDKGDIVGLASENIGLWQPQTGYYVRLGAHGGYSRTCERLTENRNNRPPTFGVAFALPFNEPWRSTMSTPVPSAALASMPPARSLCSGKTQTIPSASLAQSSTMRMAMTAM